MTDWEITKNINNLQLRTIKLKQNIIFTYEVIFLQYALI